MNLSSKIENGVAHPKNILMKMVFRALEPWCIMAAHHDALIVSFTWTRFVIFDYSIGPSTLRMNSSWSKMHEDESILVTRSSRESVESAGDGASTRLELQHGMSTDDV